MIATSRKGLSWNKKSTITRIIIMKARWDLFYWLYKEKRELPMKNRPCAIPCRSRQKVESRKSFPSNMFKRSNVEKIVHWICSNTWVSKNIECHFRIKYAKTQKPVFFRTCSNDRVSKKYHWILSNARVLKKISTEHAQTLECRKWFLLNMFKCSNGEKVFHQKFSNVRESKNFLRIFSNDRVPKKFSIEYVQTLEFRKCFSSNILKCSSVEKVFNSTCSNARVLKIIFHWICSNTSVEKVCNILLKHLSFEKGWSHISTVI